MRSPTVTLALIWELNLRILDRDARHMLTGIAAAHYHITLILMHISLTHRQCMGAAAVTVWPLVRAATDPSTAILLGSLLLLLPMLLLANKTALSLLVSDTSCAVNAPVDKAGGCTSAKGKGHQSFQ